MVAAAESAEVAEEVASAAMKAAGSAVHDEMEAAAVVKETQAALSNALRSIKSIMPAEDSTTAEEERAAVQCAPRPCSPRPRVPRGLESLSLPSPQGGSSMDELGGVQP